MVNNQITVIVVTFLIIATATVAWGLKKHRARRDED
jgi:hypothetical protein